MTLQASGATGLRTDARDDVATKERIVRSTVLALRRHAFHELDFAALSLESGLPVGVLHQHFPAWSDVLIAVLDRWTSERLRPVSSPSGPITAADYLRGMVISNLHDPVLVHLLLTVAASTSTVPKDPLAVYIRTRTDFFRSRVTDAVIADIERGDEPASLDAAVAADQLLLLFDGLQIQWMMRPEMDVVDTFDRAVGELRYAWRHSGGTAASS